MVRGNRDSVSNSLGLDDDVGRITVVEHKGDGQDRLQRVTLGAACGRNVGGFVAGTTGKIESAADHFSRDSRSVIGDGEFAGPQANANVGRDADLLASVERVI